MSLFNIYKELIQALAKSDGPFTWMVSMMKS